MIRIYAYICSIQRAILLRYLKLIKMKNLQKVEGNRTFKSTLERTGYLTQNSEDKMISLGGAENPLWTNWSGFQFERFTIDLNDDILKKVIDYASKEFNVSSEGAKEMLGLN